jgi:hypothetical protein
MEELASERVSAAEMVTVLELTERALVIRFVEVILSHDSVDFPRYQGADRGAAPRGQDFRLPDRRFIKA